MCEPDETYYELLWKFEMAWWRSDASVSLQIEYKQLYQGLTYLLRKASLLDRKGVWLSFPAVCADPSTEFYSPRKMFVSFGFWRWVLSIVQFLIVDEHRWVHSSLERVATWPKQVHSLTITAFGTQFWGIVKQIGSRRPFMSICSTLS